MGAVSSMCCGPQHCDPYCGEDPFKTLGLIDYPEHDEWGRDTDIDKVLPGLYFGGLEGAMDTGYLTKLGITHILNLATYDDRFLEKYYHPNFFQYLVINASDSPTEPIFRHFEETNRFIAQGREAGAVYVHCGAGVSRAPTAVAAYLVAEERVALKDALRFIRKIRPQVSPNEGFLRQLQQYAQEVGQPWDL
uniref:Protein-serine/threonine phosphatase n=1 Tax=Cryptomonas curvata TaxID=233186 RepID=A0A7S0QWM5_9CRYP|mmetsp:Transcript_59354/g.124032  ORF Transcript_59354/g.124032 Transcript_59354/m.124032 type:complete len:192 (+) Transcript_59354:85-660(+)